MNKRQRNQDIFTKVFRPCTEFIKQPEIFLKTKPPRYSIIFNTILSFSNYCKDIYPTQSYIAQVTGYSREEVCRVLGQLEKWGFILTNYRHMTSKQYRVSDWFFIPKIRKMLSPILPALKQLPVLVLTQLIFSSYFVLTGINTSTNVQVSLAKKSQATTREDFLRDYAQLTSLRKSVNEGENPISQAIRDLKCLNLTRWGQIELSVYPDEAIINTAARFKVATRIRDPFKWFYKLCHEYCQREGLEKNWNKYNALQDLYPIPENARMILPFAAKPPQRAPKPAPAPDYYKKRSEPEMMPVTPRVPRFVITPTPPRPVPELVKEINFFQEELRKVENGTIAGINVLGRAFMRSKLELRLETLRKEYEQATQPFNEPVSSQSEPTNPRTVTEEPIIIEKIQQRDNVSQETSTFFSAAESYEPEPTNSFLDDTEWEEVADSESWEHDRM